MWVIAEQRPVNTGVKSSCNGSSQIGVVDITMSKEKSQKRDDVDDDARESAAGKSPTHNRSPLY